MTTDTTPAVDVETPVDFEQVNAALAQRNADLEDHNVNLALQLAAAQRALESRIEQDGARQAGRRVPIQRQDHDVLVSLAQLAEETLAVQRHILAALGASGSISSVELEVDSKAAVKPHVKVYDLDPDVAAKKAQELFDAMIIKYGPKA